MALRLLIADIDQEWAYQAADKFKASLYDVDVVLCGKDAQLKAYNEKYFAALINFELQNHSGIQVIKFFNKNYPGIKIIISFENTAAKDGEDFALIKKQLRFGATYSKEDELDTLNDFLESHQSAADMMSAKPTSDVAHDEVEIMLNDDQFTKVKIDEFYSSQAVLFDVFVQLSSGKYVKILHAGDKFTKDRIDKYKNEKGVEYLHFYKKDAKKFVKFSNYLATKFGSNKKIATNTKLGLLKNVSEKFVEVAFTEGIKPQIINQAQEICANVYAVIESSKDLSSILREYNEFDPNAFSHAYAVTMFASMLIQQFEWQSKTTVEMVAMACMFHDIGKMRLPKSMMHKMPFDLSESEFEQYKGHPEFGVQLLSSAREVPNAVRQIILQHHERFDGSGFPLGIKGKKILTLANIVGLADEFYNILIQTKERKPVPALKQFLTTPELVKKFNSVLIENFIRCFVDADKLPKRD